MTGPPRWKGVFFDLDGTLADTVELILMSYRHTMRTHLGEVLPDRLWLATIGTPLVQQLRDFARDEAQVRAMLETYTVYQRGIHDGMVRPFPDAALVLESLRRQRSRVAVVTSKRGETARRTLEVCGLWEGVELLVGADDVQRGKPDPEAVVQALDRLGLTAEAGDVLFVGDSPFDLRAGRAAGTRTAAVGWGPFAREELEAEGPDYFLGEMSDVLRVGLP